MGIGSAIKRRAALVSAVVVGVVIGLSGVALVSPAGASPTKAHAADTSALTTTVLTVKVASPFPNPGDVQVQDTNGNVLATCQGSNTTATATCTVSVTSDTGIIVVAQPLTAGGFKNWTGNSCSVAPGPICHILLGTHAQEVIGHFGPTGPTPSAVPTTTFVEGDTAGCSGFSDVVTVNGTGFPSTTAVTLSDNGTQVASGTTDGSGFVQLTYTANTEPGIYRNLVMGAGGAIGTTDIFNEASFCLYQTGAGTGMDSFKVVATDLDASTTGSIQFIRHAPVPAPTNASGTYTVTTPSYNCKAGVSGNLVIKDIRGAGTRIAYHDGTTFSVAC